MSRDTRLTPNQTPQTVYELNVSPVHFCSIYSYTSHKGTTWCPLQIYSSFAISGTEWEEYSFAIKPCKEYTLECAEGAFVSDIPAEQRKGMWVGLTIISNKVPLRKIGEWQHGFHGFFLSPSWKKVERFWSFRLTIFRQEIEGPGFPDGLVISSVSFREFQMFSLLELDSFGFDLNSEVARRKELLPSCPAYKVGPYQL